MHPAPLTSLKPVDVSLTSYADYLLKSGRPKINAVRRIRLQYEQGYSQAFDYYKVLRDQVKSIHKHGKPIALLDSIPKLVKPESKQRNYEILIRGYRKFWTRHFQEHSAIFEAPERFTWSFGGVQIGVNPELGFISDGYKYVIKMYNKKDPLKKSQLDILLQLMQLGRVDVGDRVVSCVLDVRRGRLFEASRFDEDLTTLMQAEALSFAHLWHSFSPEISDPSDS